MPQKLNRRDLMKSAAVASLSAAALGEAMVLHAAQDANGTPQISGVDMSHECTVEDPEQFAALLAYSPYHNVVDGTAYPAVLLTAGEHDSRVEAWHAKKMTARLQHATSSDRPVLLRLKSGGHLAGSLDQVIDETTDWYTFLFHQVGLGYHPVAPAPVQADAQARVVHRSQVRL